MIWNDYYEGVRESREGDVEITIPADLGHLSLTLIFHWHADDRPGSWVKPSDLRAFRAAMLDATLEIRTGT